MAVAWETVLGWLDREQVWVPAATSRHATVLGTILEAGGASANPVPDAHLAALAVEHGLTVASSDHGFARLPGVRWIDPLAGD